MKQWRYVSEQEGAVPGVGFVSKGLIIDPMNKQHEDAIKHSGHFEEVKAEEKEAEPTPKPKKDGK